LLDLLLVHLLCWCEVEVVDNVRDICDSIIASVVLIDVALFTSLGYCCCIRCCRRLHLAGLKELSVLSLTRVAVGLLMAGLLSLDILGCELFTSICLLLC